MASDLRYWGVPEVPPSLMALPVELRLDIVKLILPENAPISHTHIYDHTKHDSLKGLLPLACWELLPGTREVPELYIKLNTWQFDDLQTLKQFAETAPSHTLPLIQSIQVDKVSGRIWYLSFLHNDATLQAGLQCLQSFKELKRLILSAGDCDCPPPSDFSQTWFDMPEYIRDNRLNDEMQNILNVLPPLPRDIELEVRCRLPHFRFPLQCFLTYRFTGAGWEHLATVERQLNEPIARRYLRGPMAFMQRHEYHKVLRRQGAQLRARGPDGETKLRKMRKRLGL